MDWAAVAYRVTSNTRNLPVETCPAGQAMAAIIGRPSLPENRFGSSRQRQAALALSGQRKQGIAQGGNHRGHARLTHTGRVGLTVNNIHHHFGRLVHLHQAVVVEIALPDLTVVEVDLAVERGSQAKQDATLDLVFNNPGINHLAAIHAADHLVHPYLAILDSGFHHLSHIGTETLEQREPPSPSLRCWLPPTRQPGCAL